ncbi:Membrane fusogenic activity [Marinomonas spartinae]|uniref:Ubiquinone biosynthesis accessory factor UbiK n=1 Tax=Marinomonas spartinae TaxID=1792290 RepID=A0A1A8T682_9GAMM|nr:accessory factor UbiK family protein [Marinomonas spartinae]SBS27153.1 Membrane fusogenic activity [Marinomonas spartinae]SBS35993.1 Membrane fusogenic activity [Marinomonas spartinae]
MIDQFIKQLGNGLEQAAETLGKLPKEEIRAQLDQVARNTLKKMDLVTREDFELQSAMLAKYRERLVALESRIEELEKAGNAPAKKEPAKRTPTKRAPAKKAAPKTETAQEESTDKADTNKADTDKTDTKDV